MAQKNFADAMNQIVNSTPNGLRAQINAKADKNSPALTGTPTAPTADNDTDSTQLATTEFCQNLIRRLVGSAPETLNTLVELATAINNDPDFAETIIQALDNKLNKTDAATTYLTKTDANSTYMKKSDSIDTTNLAKLNAENTFTEAQTIAGTLKVGRFNLTSNSGETILERLNSDFRIIIQSDGIVLGNLMGSGNKVSLWLNFANSNLLRVRSDGVEYYFKSDGIYLGSTKITN